MGDLGWKTCTTDLWWTNTVTYNLNEGSIQSLVQIISGTKNTKYLRGKTLYFTLSKSNWGAVNLAAQRQLSESHWMRGRKKQREEREERRKEWDTKAVWAHYVDFPSSAKQRHPGTFRHITVDQSLLSFSFTPQSFFTDKSNNSLLTAGKCLPIASAFIYFLWNQIGLNHMHCYRVWGGLSPSVRTLISVSLFKSRWGVFYAWYICTENMGTRMQSCKHDLIHEHINKWAHTHTHKHMCTHTHPVWD